MARASLALLLLLAAALPRAAAEPAAGELCRFAALDAENPFRRWLASQEVTCIPAGTLADFPPGLWNVFARADGAVSATPLLIDGNHAPTYLNPPLVPAATVTTTLPDKHTGVIYAPRRGSAFPVSTSSGGSTRVTVPANEPLWLFVVDNATPVAVISIAPLPPKTERSVDARNGGPSSVVGWLQVPEPDRTAMLKASGLSAPVVRAGSRDGEPLPPLPLLHGAFVRVRDVDAGNAELRLEGRGWIPDRRVVKAQPGLTVAPVPLLVRAAGTLVVHWNTEQDLTALERSLGSCNDEDPPQITIAVSKCPAPRAGPRSNVEECTQFREEKVDRFYGSMTFDDVAPGLFRAEMRYGKLPAARALGNVAPLRVTDLRVTPFYYTTHGSVTRGGDPLGEEVRIEFPGGFGFAPEETDEYHAVLRSPIDTDEQLTVAACDGSPRAIVLTEAPVWPGRRFNIDIPANELAVHVNDTFTREVLPGAAVKLEAMSKQRPGRNVVFTTIETSGEHGDVRWTHVPVRELRLTVTLPGYEKRIVEPFTMLESGRHDVDVQLVPVRRTRGRIVSDRPFDNAVVMWFSPTASETERADLAPDGTFVHTNWHTPDETMAVVSASHPLWVIRAPATERRQTITLAFPLAPASSFDVWLAASVPPHETRYIGVAIGGLRVPQPALAHHQTIRKNPPLMRGSGPHPIHDLLATGPIDVLLGPTSDQVAPRAQSLDLFALPQFANVPPARLAPGATDVVFTPPR
ncbi:MAG TPA: hypothetical protein VF883_20475 [Thermoanaerobaculia bacterium]